MTDIAIKSMTTQPYLPHKPSLGALHSTKKKCKQSSCEKSSMLFKQSCEMVPLTGQTSSQLTLTYICHSSHTSSQTLWPVG